VSRSSSASRYNCILTLSSTVAVEVPGSVREYDARFAVPMEPTECYCDLRKNGGAVSRVDPESLERLNRMWVDGLRHKEAPGHEFRSSEGEETQECLIVQVLDHLCREDGTERAVRERRELTGGLSEFDVMPLLAVVRYHRGIDVDPAIRDASLGKEVEELAATAADVEDRSVADEEVKVWTLPFPNELL
jgi:hypothetical protein